MEAKPPGPIGIVGIGGLGSLAIQFAKALGYEVVAIDNRVEGRDLAVETELKADWVVDFTAKDATEQIQKIVGKGGLASVVCCTDAQAAITWSLGALRTRGTLVELGLPVEHIKFDSFDLIFEEKKIIGSLVSTKAQAEEMLKVVDRHKIRSHVTTVTLDQVPELPKRYMDPHLKGRLVMKIES
jgi:D-arabinose 1-dehydrogenase-like Zn-dependent alcohol dehydrogenase